MRLQNAYCLQATQEAQQLVRAMEEGKVAGRDPSLEQLVALRQTCAEMQVAPQPPPFLPPLPPSSSINASHK